MTSDREWMVHQLANYVKKGEFILSSGKKSSYYIDLKSAMTEPPILEGIVNMLSQDLDLLDFDAFLAIESGSIPLAVALSFSMVEVSTPRYAILRKNGHLIGRLTPLDNILILEDVTTTGESLIKAIKIAEDHKVKSITAVTIVDRGEGAIQHVEKVCGLYPHRILDISEIMEVPLAPKR